MHYKSLSECVVKYIDQAENDQLPTSIYLLFLKYLLMGGFGNDSC